MAADDYLVLGICGVLIIMLFLELCSRALICLLRLVDGFQLPIRAFLIYKQGFSLLQVCRELIC